MIFNPLPLDIPSHRNNLASPYLTLLVLGSSQVVQKILELHAKQMIEDAELQVAQVYDLAMLTCRAFCQKRMARSMIDAIRFFPGRISTRSESDPLENLNVKKQEPDKAFLLFLLSRQNRLF